jgi:CheY-like chemotaxis protein
LALIVTDIRMPEMDGIEFVSKVISQGYNGIPIVFLTAFEDAARVKEALRLGASDYIVKPFDVKDFTERIFKVIEAGRLQRRAFDAAVKADPDAAKNFQLAGAMRAKANADLKKTN